MYIRLIIFLVLNFAALGIGGMFTKTGVPSDWYQNLNKAPWTPPGWMFGLAWTTIMITFSVYMAYVWGKTDNKTFLATLYIFQWILNVGWCLVFFKNQLVLLGFIVILALTILIAYMLFAGFAQYKYWALLVLPYFLWLVIATSLNAYIQFNN